MSTWWFSPLDKVNQNRFSPASLRAARLRAGRLRPLRLRARRHHRPRWSGARCRPWPLTLVGFIAVRMVVAEWLRPHFMSPRHDSPAAQPGVTSSSRRRARLAPHGRGERTQPAQRPGVGRQSHQRGRARPHRGGRQGGLSQLGPGAAGIPADTASGGGLSGATPRSKGRPNKRSRSSPSASTGLSAKYHVLVTYQPASRFWTFQTIETALFVLLAVLLAGGCAWWLRHRIR